MNHVTFVLDYGLDTWTTSRDKSQQAMAVSTFPSGHHFLASPLACINPRINYRWPKEEPVPLCCRWLFPIYPKHQELPQLQVLQSAPPSPALSPQRYLAPDLQLSACICTAKQRQDQD